MINFTSTLIIRKYQWLLQTHIRLLVRLVCRSFVVVIAILLHIININIIEVTVKLLIVLSRPSRAIRFLFLLIFSYIHLFSTYLVYKRQSFFSKIFNYSKKRQNIILISVIFFHKLMLCHTEAKNS